MSPTALDVGGVGKRELRLRVCPEHGCPWWCPMGDSVADYTGALERGRPKGLDILEEKKVSSRKERFHALSVEAPAPESPPLGVT
jgi:hypothetical protein